MCHGSIEKHTKIYHNQGYIPSYIKRQKYCLNGFPSAAKLRTEQMSKGSGTDEQILAKSNEIKLKHYKLSWQASRASRI